MRKTIGTGLPKGGGIEKILPANKEGLILYIPADSFYSNMVFDVSEKMNHGTRYGAIVTDNGKIGKGLQFDGIDDYISVGDIGNVSSYTVIFWAKRNTVIGSHDVVFGFAPTYRDSMWAYENGNIGYGDAEGGGWASWSHVWTDKTEFHQIAVVIPQIGPGQIATLYFDGQNKGNINTNTHGVFSDVKIGRFSGGLAYFSGILDEFKIYNRDLSPEEILADYQKEV